MRLFDRCDSPSGDPRTGLETTFQFYERQSRPYWVAVREQLEQWFAEYPAEAQARLAGNLRGERLQDFLGAWWELYLYVLFGRLGADCSIADLDGGGADLRVRWPDGSTVWVEATATTSSVRVTQSAKTEAWLETQVSNLRLPCDVRVGLLEGGNRPRTAALAKALQAEVDSWDARAGRFSSDGIRVGDWLVAIEPLIWPPSPAQLQRSTFKVLPFGGGWDDRTAEVVGQRLRRKARQTRGVTGTRVLAILTVNGFPREELFRRGLVRAEKDALTLWNDAQEPRCRDVAGVLHADALWPESTTRRLPDLWLNPWPNDRPSWLRSFPTRTLDALTGNATSGGAEASEVMGLPPDWPACCGAPFDG